MASRIWAVLTAGGRRGTIALAAAAVLTAGGATAIGIAVASQQHAPQPSPAAAGALSPTGAVSPAPGHVPASSTPLAGLGYAAPTSITVPAIGVTSAVRALGLQPDGSLQVPQPGPDYNKAAWYTGSPAPGQRGTAIIEGHVDSADAGPSVFFRLGALRPGDHISVTRTDHQIATFRVEGVRRYPKSTFPTSAVYGDTDSPSLRLITCGGRFDSATGHYTDNIVVFAALTATRPAS